MEQRRIERIEQSEQYEWLQMMLEGLMNLAQIVQIKLDAMDEAFCKAGMTEYCDEVPTPKVSEGHTKLIVLKNIRATFYNNLRNQTDESPCEGAGGNICEAAKNGENPIAISREYYGYPFYFGDKVKLEAIDQNPECLAWNGKVMTVMDQLAECTKKNRDLRTNRCIEGKEIRNQIDIFIPCDGIEGMDNYCEKAVVKAKAAGTCRFNLIKL